MTTAHLGMALALASVPALSAASLCFLQQSEKFPDFFHSRLQLGLANEKESFLEIFKDKAPTVVFHSHGKLSRSLSQEPVGFKRKFKCPNAYSVSGMPKTVHVLTNILDPDSTYCDRVSEKLFTDFMNACLNDQDTDLPNTLSFRHAILTYQPPLPLTRSTEETTKLPVILHRIGTLREIKHLPPATQKQLLEGKFNLHTYTGERGERHYQISLDSPLT